MQAFVTIFDILWLLAVLGLLIYMAAGSARRLDRLETALADSTARSHELARQAVEVSRLLAHLQADGAPIVPSTPPGPSDAPRSSPAA